MTLLFGARSPELAAELAAAAEEIDAAFDAVGGDAACAGSLVDEALSLIQAKRAASALCEHCRDGAPLGTIQDPLGSAVWAHIGPVSPVVCDAAKVWAAVSRPCEKCNVNVFVGDQQSAHCPSCFGLVRL